MVVLVLLMYFNMDERDSNGGRKDRKIELGMRFIEERMEHDEQGKVSLKETTSFHNNNIFLFSYNHPFYRVKDLRKEMNRCEELHRN